MLRFGTFVTISMALAAAVPAPTIFQVNLSPEEAQKYLSNPPYYVEPQYAGRTAIPLVRYNDPRFRSGESTGSYTYKSGDNDIKVRYWADSEGFHQEDNIPKVELKPVQETEDVRQARLAHENAWQENAAANGNAGQDAATAHEKSWQRASRAHGQAWQRASTAHRKASGCCGFP